LLDRSLKIPFTVSILCSQRVMVMALQKDQLTEAGGAPPEPGDRTEIFGQCPWERRAGFKKKAARTPGHAAPLELGCV